ncbi:hypothetical protein BDW22DRAFT_1363949 [Trametopsis cervina]|nr:hypothetical protein BDW22DRAFT_1363949 [Trametopsis cervina]
MASNVQLRMNVATVRILAGLAVVNSVPQQRMKYYWYRMSQEARVIIKLWNGYKKVIVYGLAISASLELQDASREGRWPNAHAISPNDDRIGRYDFRLSDARPIVRQEDLAALGELWWQEFAPRSHSPSPEPAVDEGPSGDGRILRSRGKKAVTANNSDDAEDRTPMDRPQGEGGSHLGDSRQNPPTYKGKKGKAAITRRERASVSGEETDDEGLITDASTYREPKYGSSSGVRASRTPPPADDADDEGMTTDTSRKRSRAKPKRGRSNSTTTAGQSDTDSRPALKSARKKPAKRAKKAVATTDDESEVPQPRPRARRTKGPRPVRRARVARRRTPSPDRGLSKAQLARMAELVAREVTEEDWHKGLTLAPILCSHCMAGRRVRHRCYFYLNPRDPTSSARCVRCIRLKMRCNLPPSFTPGTKSSTEVIKCMILLLKVGEDRRAKKLVLPTSVEDAALMAENRHPSQNEAAPEDSEAEFTDGEVTVRWWLKNRPKGSKAQGPSQPQATPRAEASSGPVTRAKAAAGKKKVTPLKKALPSTPVVYIADRQHRTGVNGTSEFEISSAELEEHNSRAGSRRHPRFRFRQPSDEEWDIVHTPEELCDKYGESWETGDGRALPAEGSERPQSRQRSTTNARDASEDKAASPMEVDEVGLTDARVDDFVMNDPTPGPMPPGNGDVSTPLPAVPAAEGSDAAVPAMQSLDEGAEDTRDTVVVRPAATEQAEVGQPASRRVSVGTDAVQGHGVESGVQPAVNNARRTMAVQTASRDVVSIGVQTEPSHGTGDISVQTTGHAFSRRGITSVQWGWAL